jgi:hypothetical protein
MRSFRRLALLLALGLPATYAIQAQSSSSNPPAPAQDQAQPQQPAAESHQQAPPETPQQMSVQARIRARREQRRAAAIHDAYSHVYETYANLGYLRFQPGPSLQRLTFYGWDIGLTRYFNERFGVTVGGRGYTGIAYVGLNQYSQGAFTRPKVSVYNAMAGPTYRFYLLPRYSLAGRVMGGYAHGNFSGDTNGITPPLLGLYPDSNTYAISGSIIGEANLTPNVALRLAGDYLATGFGSSLQNNVGFTGGVVYRFGKR